jgi:hypothetical protein
MRPWHWWFLLGLVLLAFALRIRDAHALTYPTPARMTTGQDITIRLSRQHECRWIDGRTATQPERAAMFLAGAGRFLPEGLLYGELSGISACKTFALGQGKSWLSLMDQRLRVYYVDASRDGEWSILGTSGCPDYDSVHLAGEKLQACSTASTTAKRACAASLYMTGPLLDWLDLRIENGQCERGARFDLVIPGFTDKIIEVQGRLVYNVPLPALTPTQMSLWTDALHRHHAGDAAACNGPISTGGTRNALLAFENSALDERQKHAFQVHEFTGTIDSRWSAQDVCDIKTLEGVAMSELDRCFHLPGNIMWACLTRARASHETWHRIGALKNTGLIRIGHHTASPQLTSTTARTPRQWLDCQIGTIPGCRLPWVPADWRQLVGSGGGM